MPSSSDLDTEQERLIFSHYKILCARLYTVGFKDEAAQITMWYANLLEVSASRLYAEAYADQKWWKEISEYSNKPGKSRSDGIYAAGNMTADAAAVLFRFGRDKEAAAFCEHADQIYNWAQRVEDEEKYQSQWTVKH